MHPFRKPLTAVAAAAAALLMAVTIAGCANNIAADVDSYASSAAPSASNSDADADSADDSSTDAADAAGTAISAQPGGGAEVASTARAVLDSLPVKGRAPKTGYARDQFGTGWKDPDRNGCDARNDMLARDLTDVTKSGPCKVVSGTLDDAYTGKTIGFVRGNDTSNAVQIDHMVALSNAWQTGAQQISAEQRERLANDPLNLQAVDGPTNQQKSDGDAATWLPPRKGYRCEYVARQVSVKAAYALWVTPPEKEAIGRILDTCPDQPAYVSALSDASAAPAVSAPSGAASGSSPSSSSAAAPAPAPQSNSDSSSQSRGFVGGSGSGSNSSSGGSSGGAVTYKNCAAVRAAGKAPLYAGQPGYAAKLDRDGDGVACE
ncbi:MAG: GmrSD restriction endonuclease domain-containing protein [Pseudoclavibacter sp.]